MGKVKIASVNFPDILYVRKDEDGNEYYFVAEEKEIDLLDDDGDTLIAEYHRNTVFAARRSIEYVR